MRIFLLLIFYQHIQVQVYPFLNLSFPPLFDSKTASAFIPELPFRLLLFDLVILNLLVLLGLFRAFRGGMEPSLPEKEITLD